jgi:carbonic anhydrase/acetyltransferase-like protein (isoleucine patch superfamily)
VEERLLLSTIPGTSPYQLHVNPPGTLAVRPNTPVLPFGIASKKATFIDPTVHILNGRHTVIGLQTYIGPYATLNSTSGFIKIGSGSFVGDNASIVSDRGSRARRPTTSILIGDNVLIGYGATVRGPSVIGGYGVNGKATEIGPNALIDGATIGPGAIVGALARVGPGVTVPSGVMVLPGSNVTTEAEATDPALGKVVIPIPSDELGNLVKSLTNSRALAAGYATLYQGNPATGINPGVAGASSSAGPFNGDLAAVSGANLEPTNKIGPRFESPRGKLVPGLLSNFHARVTGKANFAVPPSQVENRLGRGNAIRADEGQTLNFGFIGRTGNNVTINAPNGGTVNVGRFFQAGDGAVLLGGPNVNSVLGDQVLLGAGSVVLRSSLGKGTIVGPRAYVADSNLPAGSVVPAGAIVIKNKTIGTIQW